MKTRIFTAILVMGFSGLVAEILVLRELLIVFSGNELCIGIILANWLILEAFGCFVAGRKAEKSKHRLEAFTIITILFSISLPLAILLTRLLKNTIGISVGESVGLLPMFYSSFLVLLPICIFHGALFTFSCRIYSMASKEDESSAGRVYVYETLGTIIGGIVCTWLLIPYLNTIQASLWLAVLNLAVCLVLLAPYWKAGPLQKAILGVLSILILFSCYLVIGGQADKLHDYSVKAQWKNQNVVHYQNSKYGNICTLENEGQYIFFLDGIASLITPVPDMPFVEEFVHIPLLAHPDPERILVLSGGAGGVINEALKHPSVKKIEYSELDPLLLDLLRKFPTPLTEFELNDPRVKIRHIDGRLLLKTTGHKYDLILVGIQAPSNLQANRFFTKEFFSLAKEKLNNEGILVLGLPGSLTYSSDELKDLNSCIFNTLKSAFSHIRVIPGDNKNLFLSSQSPGISTIDKVQIIERLNQRNLEADVIVPWRIENKLHHGWRDWFSSFIDGGSRKINSDFNPVGLFYSISHWNALFAPSFRGLFKRLESINLNTVAILAMVFLLLYFLLRTRNIHLFQSGVPFSIITTGFAGMIFDLMLIFAFQAIYGYVFSWIGLLVAFFMAGAACGAMVTTRVPARTLDSLKLFMKIDLAIICWSFGWAFIFLVIHAYQGVPGVFFLSKMLFLLLSLICGLLVGSQFTLANRICLENNTGPSRTAGLLYASDLLGGWFGGIAGAVVLLPVLGLVGASMTVGLLKLTSFFVIATQCGPYSGGVKT